LLEVGNEEADEAKLKKLFKLVSKDKKKGKLNKDDEKEVKVELQVYSRMFGYLGGFYLMLPFVISISLFTYLDVFREKKIKTWANKIAKEQHNDFYFSCY
jgi:hypothetical protein